MPFRLPLPQWMRPRRYAASIIFEATSACNLACQYCYNAWKAPIPGDVPTESSVTSFKTLDTLRTKELLARAILGSRARNITWSGGEPSLRPDLIELMRYVQRMGVSQNLITNGTLAGAGADRGDRQVRGAGDTGAVGGGGSGTAQRAAGRRLLR